ncbi:transposase [Lactovum miscens]|uniref:transposase n=1 Tax=Lactovum miscens TaxID=190387 RepID=UPI0039C8E0B0
MKVIVIDRYSPYLSLIKACFKNAKISIDHFHIVQHVARAFNKTRIKIMKKFSTNSKEYRRLK